MEEKKNKAKRFYWLKLPNDYFKRLDQRKMLRQPNGETMQRIYLKLLLLAVDKDGFIRFQNVFDDLTEEIAEEIFEDVELVKLTVEYCKKNGLLEMNELDSFLPQVIEMTGSETDSARRMRTYRERQSSQCDTESLQSDESSHCDVREREEKEKEKREETDTRDKEKHPSLGEVADYLSMMNVKSFTAEEFHSYYSSLGWRNKYGTPIVDWKAQVNSWVQRKEAKQEEPTENDCEKDKLDFMSEELISRLREVGALDDDGSLSWGDLEEYGLYDAVLEADRKANEWNRGLHEIKRENSGRKWQ